MYVELLVYAGLASSGVGLVGMATGYLLRHRSIRWQLGLVAVVAVLSVLAGVLALANRMLISDRDLKAITLVVGVSALTATIVAALLGAALVRWSEALQAGVRSLGRGEHLRRASVARAAGVPGPVLRAGDHPGAPGGVARARAPSRGGATRARVVGLPRPAHAAGRDCAR